MPDLDFPLVPGEQGLAAEADLAAAAQSALSPPFADAQPSPSPYGLTWAFDFVAGQMVRRGASPAEASGTDALIQWCLMAVYSARYAHAVFSDDFAIERPYDMIGHVDPTDLAADFEARLRGALTVHDRVADVQAYSASYDPAQGVFLIDYFELVTDDGTVVPVQGVAVNAVT